MQRIEDLIFLLDTDETSPEQMKLLKASEEFNTYITNNSQFIPNYGERDRNGERISTGFVESTVNQLISKRIVRTPVLDDEWRATFDRWYSGTETRVA